MAKTTETTLAPTKPDVDALRFKTPKDVTFGDVLQGLTDAGDIVDGREFGTGYAVLGKDEKGRLAGVPFIIQDWTMNEGDFGSFVSLTILTQSNERLILNDGSTGIAKQMEEISASGNTKAIYVKKGLRRSDYEYTDPKDGSKKPATTYYLDFSA